MNGIFSHSREEKTRMCSTYWFLSVKTHSSNLVHGDFGSATNWEGRAQRALCIGLAITVMIWHSLNMSRECQNFRYIYRQLWWFKYWQCLKTSILILTVANFHVFRFQSKSSHIRSKHMWLNWGWDSLWATTVLYGVPSGTDRWAPWLISAVADMTSVLHSLTVFHTS